MKNLGLTIVLVLFLSACSSTFITSTWKAPDITTRKYGKIMVVGIIRDADRNIRERMEEHLVGDLKDLGYNAFSAYHEYGPKAFEGMNEEQANSKLASEGIDAVITIVLLDKQKERYYVPGQVIYSPFATYHNRWYGYYHSLYARIETPGYFAVSTKYFWESNFYDLTTDKLLFSVQTQTFDPASADMLAHQYGQKIVQSMVKYEVLQKQGEALKTL